MYDEIKEKKIILELNNGIIIPAIGLGTGVIKRFYRNKIKYSVDIIKAIIKTIKYRKIVRFLKNDVVIKMILKSGIKYGYRLIDTARLYGHSEKYIGDVTKNFDRKELFIITKVSEDDLIRYPHISTVHDNLSLSLKNLKTDYVDAYLLHFPGPKRVEMYREMENEFRSGRARLIGVCNFDIEELDELIEKCEIKPMINQIELNPLNTRVELREYCKKRGIQIIAHTPTARMDKRISESEILKFLAKKYNKSIFQIIYRWHYQNSVIPLVASTSRKHLKRNLDIFDFTLTDEEMRNIDMMNINYSCDKFNNKKSDCQDFVYNI